MGCSNDSPLRRGGPRLQQHDTALAVARVTGISERWWSDSLGMEEVIGASEIWEVTM